MLNVKNVVTRALSGSVYVVIIISAILSGTEWYLALAAILAILGLAEFFKINTRNNKLSGVFPLDVAGALLIISVPYFFNSSLNKYSLIGLTAYFVLRFVVELFLKNDKPVEELGKSMMAQMYVSVPLATSVALYLLGGWELVLSIFIFIWINDTGAFCVGSLFGKRRLFERISPKKSWEGFWGGFSFCVEVAYLLSIYHILSGGGMEVMQFTLMAALVSVFATLGDLVESMMKRSLSIKDSGNLIPGHGGILDRIDSFLIVSPAILCFYLLIAL